MYPLTIGLAISTEALWDEVHASIEELPVRVVIEQRDMGDLGGFLERVERLRPDAVLVDLANLSGRPLSDVVTRVRSTVPECMIVALNTTADPETILTAIRSGANEYLYPPVGGNLRKALERRSAERGRGREGAAAGKTVAFFAAKGGCGATTLACHISVELGRLSQSVLLADLDLEAGLIGFLMKSKSAYSVLDAANNLHRLDLSYWKGLVSNGIPNLEIIAAPSLSGIRQAPASRDLEVRHVIGFTRMHYDWTVADLGRSLHQASFAVLEQIDEAYLVSTLDVPALHQAKQIVKAMTEAGFSKERLHLILNRVPRQLDITAEELEKMLGVKVFAMLPDCFQELYEAYAEGKLLNKNTQLGRQISKLATRMAGVEEPTQKSRFSFFR